MNLNFKELVLSKLGEGKVRRMTFGELRAATGINHGLLRALHELKDAGEVYCDSPNDAIDEMTVISPCSVIVLEGKRRLTVLAPDEARLFSGPRGGPVWEILVHISGAPDPVSCYAQSTIDFDALWRGIQDRLYDLISSSLVEETSQRVEQELQRIFDGYHARNVPTNLPNPS